MANKGTKTRFDDQKGQWKSTTSASVKKRQSKELKKLESMLKPTAKKTGKK